MEDVVILDSGPLGLASNPAATPEVAEAKAWLAGLLLRGTRVVVPEIADYEVRRELLRAGRARGIARLDEMKTALDFHAITTAVMLRAAGFWAEARQAGRPTASRDSLDADVILAAQSLEAARLGERFVVATNNAGRIARFVPARPWRTNQ